MKIIPIILCGGAGSRLWPLSRASSPKQFQNLTGPKSMLTLTLDRVSSIVNKDLYAPARVISSSIFAGEIPEHCNISSATIGKIVLEPCMRDTSAAIAAAIVDLHDAAPDQIVLILPSDHHVSDINAFANIMQIAANAVEADGGIMTIGIQPTRPETQFGYIERESGNGPVYDVAAFKEKPDEETAQKFLTSGKFFWNAGIFMFRVSDMANEFIRQQPKIWEQAKKACEHGEHKGNILFLNESDFVQCEKISIDYGIMEYADKIRTIMSDFDWCDVGSWNQLYDIAHKDENGNVLVGDIHTHNVHNSYIRAEDRAVTIAGIKDIVVVSHPDVLMLVHRDQSYLVKELHSQILQTDWPPLLQNTTGKQIPNSVQIHKWLFECALPFWAKNGFDYANGGAHEALDYHGKAINQDYKRFSVIPRQVYCYATAYELGWNRVECKKILDHCVQTLTTTGWHEDSGFIHLFDLTGSVQDDTRYIYDQCIALTGFAKLFQTTQSSLARHWAEKTLRFVDEKMLDSVNGGFFETPQKEGIRRASSQMHFFEAMITWYQATGQKTYINRAAKIVDLFKMKLFDHENWCVHETFDSSWVPLEIGTYKTKPGHHYQWVWLLLNYCIISDDSSIKDYARKLYATAISFGHHPKTDGVAQFVDSDGANPSQTAQMWCQTAALKAAISLEQNGMNHCGNLQTRMLDQLYNRYLITPEKGGWYDAFDHNGRIVSAEMPAGAFYHVFCAFKEYLEHNEAFNINGLDRE